LEKSSKFTFYSIAQQYFWTRIDYSSGEAAMWARGRGDGQPDKPRISVVTYTFSPTLINELDVAG
jgi:hypothetical protein